ncbi:hypothetical protein Tco_1211315 [Tanacetum coccineum]
MEALGIASVGKHVKEGDRNVQGFVGFGGKSLYFASMVPRVGVGNAPLVRVSDGTSHETLPRISEADLEVSHQWISVFLSTHLAYELLPESGNAGPDENLKDITLKILQNKVATLPITHSTSNNGSYLQLLYLALLSELFADTLGILQIHCRYCNYQFVPFRLGLLGSEKNSFDLKFIIELYKLSFGK